MTGRNPDRSNKNRRQFLTALGVAGVTGIAGCSGQSGSGDGNGSTASPTPVRTTRPSSESTETPAPTVTINISDIDPEDLDPEVFDPNLTEPVITPLPDLPTVTDERRDPSATSASANGIDVTVTPNRQSTGTQSLGNGSQVSKSDTICATENQRATADGGGLLTENLVLNHRLNEIWPGAIIPATSVANGGYGPALSPSRLPNRQPSDIRNPITLTLYSDANRFSSGNPEVSKVIDPPTSNGVEQARVELLQDVQQGTSAAQLSFDIEQIHSEKHLDINLGVDYNNAQTSISGDFSYSRDAETNKLLVKLYQVYYFMGVSFPNPNGSFVTDSSVTRPNDLLISDVSFGRLLLFSAESKHTVRDMKASLDATFSGAGGSASADLDVKHKRVLDETRIKGQAIGGGATTAAQLISDFGEDGLSRVRNYAIDGADYGPNNPGAPIGFTARYLDTLDRSNTYLTTEYNARTCYPKTRKFRVHNVQIEVKNAGGDGGGNLRLYGDITVTPRHPNDTYVARVGNAWSRDRDQFVEIDEGTTKTLAGVDQTVEFTIGKNRAWTDYMEDASIDVIAKLRERDALSDDEYQGESKTGSWKPTEPVSRTPTIVFSEHNNVAHLTFDVSPVPLQ